MGDEAVPAREALTGLFDLVPSWSPDIKSTKFTYNARTETVASFRDAWKHAQHCIIPADTFFEPDWRSGRAIPTQIGRADGEPMGIAGLWSSWKSPKGEIVNSFTMLTINATHHSLMQQFHKPVDEKCMVVILAVNEYDDWLQAGAAQSQRFFRLYPAALLEATQPLAPHPTLF